MIITMDDNHVDFYFPFKGPFKGKGLNRKASQHLDDQYAEVRQEMLWVVDDFQKTFPRPRPVNLSIHQRHNNYHALLSWRYAVRGGSYLHLFGNQNGEKILDELGPHTTKRLAEFDRMRLTLNFKSKVVFSALQAYRLYKTGCDMEDAWFNGRRARTLKSL
jgi:hypothetical protein